MLTGRTVMAGYFSTPSVAPRPTRWSAVASTFLVILLAIPAAGCDPRGVPAEPGEPVAAVLHARNLPLVDDVSGDALRVVFQP